MELEFCIAQLAQHAESIRSLAAGISDEQARWKPTPETWSLLEVINHLYDEEREDFRVRLDILLHRPEQAWPPIRPQEWVTEREYNQRSLAESVQNFLNERKKSLEWLGSLDEPEWERSATAPWGQPIQAGDMAAAWAAHDLLHTRQLVELHWAWINRQLAPYQVNYAGDW